MPSDIDMDKVIDLLKDHVLAQEKEMPNLDEKTPDVKVSPEVAKQAFQRFMNATIEFDTYSGEATLDKIDFS
jgi:hypothetical protein